MGHFYDPKTGQLIDGDLRQARKVRALPSPTTVLTMLSSHGLLEYFRRQIFEATATTERKPGWSDDTYYEEVKRFADEHGKAARDRGGDFHNLIQQFHLSTQGRAQAPIVTGDLAGQYDAYLRWYENNVERSILVEEIVFGDGYGGTLDHHCLLKDGRHAITDTKTQFLKGGKGFNHYLSWALQLGAYGGADLAAVNAEEPDCLVSIIVSSNDPVVLEAHVWQKPVAYYHNLFMGLLAIYQEEKGYFPLAY